MEERLAAGTRWQDNGLVFTMPDGRPLSVTTVIRTSFRPTCAKAGIAPSTSKQRGLRFHDLRHSAATLLLSQGVPARAVMEMLGHTTIATTMNRYTKVIPELLDDAAAAMDRALGGRERRRARGSKTSRSQSAIACGVTRGAERGAAHCDAWTCRRWFRKLDDGARVKPRV